MTIVREARLKSAYAHLYPELAPNTWIPATDVGAAILMSQLQSKRPLSLGERLLPDEHFEFRGGAEREPAQQRRTRWGEAGPSHRH